MSLAIFLPIGDSLEELEKNGKLSRLTDYYIPAYQKRFDRIYVFSYGDDQNFSLPDRCVLVPNNRKINRFIYTFLIPVLHFRLFAKIKTSRVLQLSGIMPALLAKLFWGTKIAITYGYDYRLVEELMGYKYKGFLYFLIEKLLLPLCDVIIFSSRTIQSTIPTLNDKSVYIPNGIDLDKFKPARVKRSPKKFLIVTQSRLSPEKNLDVLIKAVSYLPKQKTLLVIIGTGLLKRELEQIASRFGVELRILEKVPNDKMPSQYQCADIYVHPSLTEGSPKSLIEAAACGCCILASDIPQNREILDDAAIYFNPKTGDLKEKLQNLYEHKDLRTSLGKEANLKVIGHFDINLLLRKESEMLRQLSAKP